MECPDCTGPIRGSHWNVSGGYTAPSFCTDCGRPFPWTQSKVQAAVELAQELEVLDEQDRAMLEESIDDLVRDTPAATVAVVRFKRIMGKVGHESASMFREILVGVLSEGAEKMLANV